MEHGLMEKDKKILEISDLTVSFGARRVIDNVNFSLYSGEVLALVGESGSGKTLTAFSILDLLPRTAALEKGKIMFNGKNVLDLDHEEIRDIRGNEIAMVFQEPFTALNPVMRAGDQIMEVMSAHDAVSRKNRKERMKELLHTVKLPAEISSHYPHELSGGMRQRVILAMALSCDPSVLILDEPTTALDVSIQKHVLDLIKQIQKERRLTILFITHDFSIVNMIADRVCVMRNGRILDEDGKEEVFTNPVDPYTRQLIACIPRLGDKRERLPVVENAQDAGRENG